MQVFLCLFVMGGGACLAHYTSARDSTNLILVDEPRSSIPTELVECPVCENVGNWVYNEECTIERGNKRYKRCRWGVYSNEICGGRPDCFRGPGERCTEKMELDFYGQRCARGTYCNKLAGLCTGMGFSIDSNVQWQLNQILNPDHRYHTTIIRERENTSE